MFLEANTDKACPCAPMETQTIQGILEAATMCPSPVWGLIWGLYTLHEEVNTTINITSLHNLARSKMQAIPMWPSAV